MKDITVEGLLSRTVWFYGMCPHCHEIHADLEKLVAYLNWLAEQHIIHIDHLPG